MNTQPRIQHIRANAHHLISRVQSLQGLTLSRVFLMNDISTQVLRALISSYIFDIAWPISGVTFTSKFELYKKAFSRFFEDIESSGM